MFQFTEIFLLQKISSTCYKLGQLFFSSQNINYIFLGQIVPTDVPLFLPSLRDKKDFNAQFVWIFPGLLKVFKFQLDFNRILHNGFKHNAFKV